MAEAEDLREEKETREEEREHWERQRQAQESAEQEKSEDEADDVLALAMLMAQEHRQMLEDFIGDMADARLAVLRAYERALAAEEAAREALEEAQSNAIVLSDGRRVYFTADGTALYGEDHREITDAAAIAEARERQTRESSSYEEFRARSQARTGAGERAEQLRQALERIDDLQQRMERGLSPEELIRAQDELREILAALPPEVRADYEQVQERRKSGHGPAHREADPDFPAAPPVRAEFFKAHSDESEKAAPQPEEAEPGAVPAYRARPDF